MYGERAGQPWCAGAVDSDARSGQRRCAGTVGSMYAEAAVTVSIIIVVVRARVMCECFCWVLGVWRFLMRLELEDAAAF